MREAEAERTGSTAGPSTPLVVDAPSPRPAAVPVATSEAAEALEAYAKQMVPRVAAAPAAAPPGASTDLKAYFKASGPSLLEAAGEGEGAARARAPPRRPTCRRGPRRSLGRTLGGEEQLDAALRAAPPGAARRGGRCALRRLCARRTADAQ